MRWHPWSNRDRDADLRREIDAHLDAEAEEQQARGLPPAEAHFAARRTLGNATLVQERTRDAWGWRWLDRLRQDVRYAVRTLRRAPGFTVMAVLSLALGIGANTAIFSLLNAVVLRLLPVPEPRQLVQFTYTFPSSSTENWNSYFDYPQFERLRAESRTCSAIFSGVRVGRVNLESRGVAGLAQGDAYTDNFFSGLGVSAQYGRLFAPGDDRSDASAIVLGDRYWRRRFAGDPSIVGQIVTVNQVPFTVVGIAPRDFFGITVGYVPDFWVPLHALDRWNPGSKIWQETFASWLLIGGRVAPGIPHSQAEAELDLIHRRVLSEQLASQPNARESLRKLVAESHLVLHSAENGVAGGLRHNYEAPLKFLMAIAGMVLLISCANVANLLLARASRRSREIALRMALGSGRFRLVRQVLIESILIACAGGALALAFAWWGSAALVHMISTGEIRVPIDTSPDWRLFAFTAFLSLVTGILFGLAPALRATRVDPGPALKEGSRPSPFSARAADRLLVALQVTLCLLLITGASLFTRTLDKLRSVDVGYRRDNILMFSVDAKLGGYRKSRGSALYRDILAKVAALPDVQSASLSIVRPIDSDYYLVDGIGSIDHRALPDSGRIHVAWNSLSPGYFGTVGMSIVAGRDFEMRDAQGPPVVVVNESLARRAFPNQNPLGHFLEDAQVIGVVKDARYGGARELPRPILYRPLFRSAPGLDPSEWVGVGAVSFELRYRAGAGIVEEARRAVAAIDRNLPVFSVKTLRVQTEESFLRERLLAMISSFFGTLALLLACVGLYGLMAYAVSGRTAEIGIRLALGARRHDIIAMVVRETVWMIGAGILAGVPLALWASRFAKSLLFGLEPTDPGSLGFAVATMLGAAAVAVWLPARRATRVDPMVALRCE